MFVGGFNPYPISEQQKRQFREAIRGSSNSTESGWQAFFDGVALSIGSALADREAQKTGLKKNQQKSLDRILKHLNALIAELSDEKLSPWLKWNLISLARSFEFPEGYTTVEDAGRGYRTVEKVRLRKTSLWRAFGEIVAFRNLVTVALSRLRGAAFKGPQEYARIIAHGVAFHMNRDLRVRPTAYAQTGKQGKQGKQSDYARALDVALQIAGKSASKESGRKELMRHGLRLLTTPTPKAQVELASSN